jgi:hypothetical protein
MLGSIALLMIGLFAWQSPAIRPIALNEGDIAPFDIVAPSPIRYESEVLNERARQRAMAAIPDQYEFDQGRALRQQLARLRQIIEQVTTTRQDALSNRQQKLTALLAIDELAGYTETMTLALDIDDNAWSAVSLEAVDILKRLMRDELRESQISIIRQRIPILIDSDFNEVMGNVTATLAQALLRPTSYHNEQQTVALRAQASANVAPQIRIFERGQAIARAGDPIDAQVVEAIQQLQSLQKQWDRWTTLRALVFTTLVLLLACFSIYRLRPQIVWHYNELALLVLTTVIWLLMAKFMVAPHDWLPYLYPLPALALLIALLIDIRVASVFVIMFALIAHYFAWNNPLIVVYLAAGGLAAILTFHRPDRLSSFLWSGVSMSLAHFAAYTIFRIIPNGFLTFQIIQGAAVSLLNGLISAGVAFLGYYLLGNLLGIITTLQLHELSRPTHPLLRQLQFKAPGTYFHTILVSNLAERASAAIGADALLARVGAYYHDIGKTLRPYFFTENMIDGASPHDRLDPLTSAQIIISHVSDGLDLAQKYRLPVRIRDFIREHHGKSLVRYFYIQAQRQAENGVQFNERDFRYPGPNPRSKETAIVMLADSCEATVRSRRPATRQELRAVIDQIVDDRMVSGELSECDLTLHELRIVKDVFTNLLEGVHHPRISYPDAKRTSSAASLPVSNDIEGAAERTALPAPVASAVFPMPAPSFMGKARAASILLSVDETT